jgi:hypothetical protein
MPEPPVNNPAHPAAPSPPPRFSWPMRIFLSVIIFDMVFHSLAVLTPYMQWCKELEMTRYPYRLPTADEMHRLAEKQSPNNPDPVGDRVLDSLDSVWDFFKPWPSESARRKVRDWPARARYALCWLTTRLEFCEHLAGIHQEWVMFSPSVANEKRKARASLEFADRSHQEVRFDSSDPADLTHYSHWFVDRINNYEVEVCQADKITTKDPSAADPEACLGYCNLLAHRHRRNGRGKPLVRIFLHKVTYQLPEPGVDARAFLEKQSGPPENQRERKPFFVADVKTRPDGTLYVKQRKP